MKPDTWASALARWAEAGLVDAEAAGRIRAFEAARAEEGGEGLRWPVLLAFGLGALMVGAGTLLFVAAHWDGLGPAARMTLVLRGRRFGFSLEEIRQWLLIYGKKGEKPQLEAWLQMADRQLDELQRQRSELDVTIDDLRALRTTAAEELAKIG